MTADSIETIKHQGVGEISSFLWTLTYSKLLLLAYTKHIHYIFEFANSSSQSKCIGSAPGTKSTRTYLMQWTKSWEIPDNVTGWGVKTDTAAIRLSCGLPREERGKAEKEDHEARWGSPSATTARTVGLGGSLRSTGWGVWGRSVGGRSIDGFVHQLLEVP